MLTANEIGYWYTNSNESLFKNVNLNFENGQSYAIVGESGSGKTTFLSLLAGLDKPKQGQIKLDEKIFKKWV